MSNLLIALAITLIIFVLFLLSRNWRRVVQIVAGWGLYGALNWFYDNPFWLLIQNHFGVVVGSAMLTVGAFLINFCVLHWYQKKGVDWLGVGVLEEIKEKGHAWAEKLCNHSQWYVKIPAYIPAKFFQVLVWGLKKNDVLAFVFLSVTQDSFITTAFLRHGRFGKLSSWDYVIFSLSTIVSCVVHSVWMATILSLIKAILLKMS